MAPSPARNTGMPVTATVTAGGKLIDTTRIVSIETWTAANRIPRARVVLFDGEPDDGSFPFSDSKSFVPGAELVLSAGYGVDAATLHTGVVVRHAIRIAPGEAAQLVVESADKLVKMTLARHSAVSQQTSDSELIETLVSANGGSVGRNEAATTAQEAIVQGHASDWDIMLLRAEANGCVALVDSASVDIVKPGTPGDAAVELQYGDSIIAFDGVVDALHQVSDTAISSSAWSYADQKVASATSGSVDVAVPGNLASATLAKVFGIEALPQRTGASVAEDALTAWSSAALMRHRLAQVQGSVRFQGTAAVRAGGHVKLKGVGDRFAGGVFVSGVRHVIRDGSWQTTLDLGMAMESFASRNGQIADPGAAGLSSPLKGLHIGQVVTIADDPNGDFRVQVTLPLLDKANAVWARLGSPYASKAFGIGFFPEVGDEVVLGFMNEDPASPVILGSVYSNRRAPTHAPVATNDTKAIVTASKLEVNFNDKDTILKISTPGGRIVTLDDKAGEVKIEDPNGHSITMTKESVDILSKAKLTINSTGDMTIGSKGKMTLSAAQSYDLSAMSVAIAGKTGLDLSSKTDGSLKTATMLTVQSAMVKIN